MRLRCSRRAKVKARKFDENTYLFVRTNNPRLILTTSTTGASPLAISRLKTMSILSFTVRAASWE